PFPAPESTPGHRTGATSAFALLHRAILLPPVPGGHLGECGTVDLIGCGDRHLHGRERPKGHSALAALEDGSLTEDGARPQLVDLLAVVLGGQHPVEEQKQIVALLSLLDEGLAFLDAADLRL